MPNFSNQLDNTLPESIHARIHRGQMFAATVLNTLANATSVDYLIIAGAKPMHFAVQVSNSHELSFAGYSGTVYSAAGTPLTLINANFGSSNTPLGTVNANATITNIGTVRYSQFMPGGTGGNAVGGISNAPGRLEEFVLAANLAFAVRLTNNSGQTANYSLVAGWYEP